MDYPKMIKNHTKIVLTRKKDGEKITILDTTPENRVVGKVPAGIPITECVDDTLDTSVFIIKAYQRELFEEFDIVELTIGSSAPKQMVVASDVSELYQRDVEPQTYQHTVTLVELTKILEKFKIYSLNLTNTQDNLLKQAEKAINNTITLIDTVSMVTPQIFSLSASLRTLLETKPSEDFYFSNTDLRTVMDGILLSNNCRCFAESIEFDNVGDIANVKLGYRSLSAVKEVSPVWEKDVHGRIVNEVLTNNAHDYAGKLYAKGLNTLCKNTLTFTDMFKSGEATVTTENAKITLPFPISEKGIKSLKIPVQIVNSFNVPATSTYYEVDIASRIIEATKYDLLVDIGNTETLGKNQFISFNIGSNELLFLNKYAGFLGWEIAVFQKVVEELMLEQHNVAITLTNTVNIDYTLNNPFTCTYYPQITTYSEVTKPGVYEKDRLHMGIWSNQTENNLDIDRHGKHLLSLIRRTGNGEQYIDVEASYYDLLLPLMSKIKDTGYVIYKREIGVYDTFCKCRYYLSKDFNAITSKAGVNRVKHLYDIPLESDECPLINKRYMVFSKKEITVPESNFNNNFLVYALRTVIGRTSHPGVSSIPIQVKYMLFRTVAGKTFDEGEIFPQDTEDSSDNKPYTDTNYRFMLPCVSYGQGKAMNFIAKPLDNYSVNYSRDGYHFSLWGDGGNRMTYCRYVSKFQNTVGECHEFDIDYAFKCDMLDSPDVYTDSSLNEEYNNFVQLLPVSDQTKYLLATTAPFKIYYEKDRTQTPVFITSVECIPVKDDFGKVIIGTAFCRDNNLVVDKSSSGLLLPRKLVLLKEPLNDTDESIDGKEYTVFLDDDSLIHDNIQILNNRIRFVESYSGSYEFNAWAITNENNEILIGCNDSNISDIYFAMSDTPI